MTAEKKTIAVGVGGGTGFTGGELCRLLLNHERVSRIVPGSVTILPKKLPGVRPNGRPRQVILEMAPTIARFGVSHRKELIGEPTITPLDGGWVRVEGQTYDVFDLARNLLYYGKNCRVLGQDELLQEMRKLVTDLREVYQL